MTHLPPYNWHPCCFKHELVIASKRASPHTRARYAFWFGKLSFLFHIIYHLRIWPVALQPPLVGPGTGYLSLPDPARLHMRSSGSLSFPYDYGLCKHHQRTVHPHSFIFSPHDASPVISPSALVRVLLLSHVLIVKKGSS